MRPLTIALVAGARPNFMKIAPLIRAFERLPDRIRYRLIHTGQHFDRDMNDVFFEELGIPAPHASLGCGGGSHAEQTAKVMVAMEAELTANPVDMVLVVGDVNSTLAAAIVAKKLQLQLIHVEAGLRSGDRAMPEEINRLATDAISDILFVTESSGVDALTREGHPAAAIHFVGNVMIDNLFFQVGQLEGRTAPPALADIRRKLEGSPYGVVTLHRPSNVDVEPMLRGIVGVLREVSQDLPLVFPMHPRTRARCEAAGIELGQRIHVLPPLSYMDFLGLWKDAAVILTDSGGLQEESTALGVRCVTLRESTERPATISEGTNTLVGTDPERILAGVRATLARPPSEKRPRHWDGHAAERIAQALLDFT